ncbi:YggT family protein [Teredinibacter waterburyi]|jgi:YGGT family.|uniref:YggT family protein n=1 Tax=Teredinibacter waterburyi TaxID=1500538 RepID=UPI00165F7F17|nr:YggT family protein [Teredinibacter waterburyi]
MNPFAEILTYIVETLGTLFLLLVLLRFLLQLARADFYNQISQGIVKITNPLLKPVRRIIPGVFGIDIASLVLALLVQLVVGELIALILVHQIYNPVKILIWGSLGILNMLTYIAYGCGIIIVVSSFIAPFSTNPAIVLARQLMEPILAPVQRIIPPLGGFDFSILFVFMGITILQKLLNACAYSVGLVPKLILGY